MSDPAEKLPEFMTRQELCAWLGCTPQTVWNWEQEGMPSIQHARKMRVYRMADILAWVEKNGKRERPMKYIVGTELFATKGQIKARVRKIVAAGAPKTALVGADHDFVLALFARHPQADEKIGVGIARIVRVLDAWGVKALALEQIDGSDTDISWVRCIDETTPESYVLSAFRREIDDQRIAAKSAAFAASDPHRCPLLGIYVRWDEADVDHEAPDTFLALARRFCDAEGIALASIETDGWKDGEQKKLLRDRALAARWQEFHRTHARLRVLSSKAHRSLKRA